MIPSPNPTVLSAQNPWPGLRAFTENDREFFFGRERETAELLTIVKRSSVVILYGQSGLGKTSLLQAGLFPELKNLDFLPLRLRLDHSEGAPSMAQQIKQTLALALENAKVDAPAPGERETVWEYFHRRDLDFWGPRNRLLAPVIVLDQFEEVFTLGQRSEAAAARVAEFAVDLESVIEHRPPSTVRERLELQPEDALKYDFQRQPLKFLLSLREDFLAQLDPWRTRMPSLLPHRFRLERMTGAQALTVVARAGRDLVGPDVAQDIVDFVSTSQRKRTSRSMEQRDVEPALLSVVCDELNRRRLERGQSSITSDLLTVEREAIIRSFYERAFEGVDGGVRDWVEDELLTSSGYRDRAALEDALRLGLSESDFDVLVDRRVLHREEREGVVWLELTHDLLTDPAAQSRAAREANAAARREAEYARKLRRTRQWAAVFAVLLLGMVSAFVYMFVLRKQMARATETANAMTEAAGKEKAAAASHFDRLIKAVDGRGEIIREYLTGDMRIPAATVRKVIDTAEQDFESLGKIKATTQLAASSDLELRHARFLAASGEALRQVGKFKEGIEKSQEALNKLDSMGEPRGADKAKDGFLLTRAQALYVRGACRSAMGDLNEARQDLEQSSKLAVTTQDAAFKPDEERTLVLSKIALGEVEVKAFAFNTAAAHFEQAMKLIRNVAASDESRLWTVMALQGVGLSQTDDVQGERWFQQAAAALGSENPSQESNLRRKRLMAELGYQRGFIAYRLDKLEEANKFFEQANEASEDLNRRDPDNLDWRLSQVQSWRGLGIVHVQRGEWDLAQEILERTEKSAKELNELQPAWVQARFLCGAVIFSLGELIQNKYRELPPDSRDPKDLERALKRYTEARAWLQNSVQSAPKNLALLASVISSQGRIYYTQAFDSQPSAQAKSEKFSKALHCFDEARQTLRPLEATQKQSIARNDSFSGDVLMQLDKPQEAISFYRKAVRITSEAARKAGKPESYYTLSSDHVSLGNAYARNHQTANARDQYARAADDINRALKSRPGDIQFLRQKADVHAAIFDSLWSENDWSRAVAAMEVAVTTVWTALQQDYSNKALNDDLNRYRRGAERSVKQMESLKIGKNPAPAGGSLKSAAAPNVPDSQALVHKLRDLLASSDPAKLLEYNQQRAWVLAPLIPGAWRTLGAAELETARSQLLAANPRFKDDQVLGIRKLPVDFYDNAALYEAALLHNGKRGIISYLQRGEKMVVLDGWRDRITEINREAPPKLDSVERATAYLRFYVGAIQSEDGRFMLVDQLEDLHWLPTASEQLRDDTAKRIKPLVVQASQGAGWKGIGTVQLAHRLYYIAFHVSRVGYTDLVTSGGAIEKDLPISVEGFLGGVRGPYTPEMGIERLEASPKNPEAVQKLPARYANLKRWQEAARAQLKWVAYCLRDSNKDSELQQKLPDAYDKLSWYQLMSGDFAGALSSADAGKKLREFSIALDADRAHALYFMGRTREAEAIYKRLETSSEAREVLDDRLNLCMELKHWKDAVLAQQELLTLTQRQAKNETELRAKLPGEYTNLAWVQLMARDFNGALESSEAGRKLDASHLPLETNRAHALMFLNRTEEAEAIYLEHRGKRVYSNSDKTWEQVILEDFDALEKEGLTNPEMAKIRDKLKTKTAR